LESADTWGFADEASGAEVAASGLAGVIEGAVVI